MPKKIEVTVAGQIVTPRNISVGNVTEDSGAVLCISFDGTWSGYYKSVVFYDKRKKKPIKYEFADSGSHVEVVLPEAVTIEYGKHPFAVVGSNADGMTKITALGYIIVDNTLFPGLNQSSVDEVRSDDAYSSFVKAYDDVSQSIDDAYAITGDALVVAEEINEKVKEVGDIASGVEGSKESAEQSAKEAKESAESIASLEATVIKDDGKEYVINLSNGTNIDITTPNLKGADGKDGRSLYFIDNAPSYNNFDDIYYYQWMGDDTLYRVGELMLFQGDNTLYRVHSRFLDTPNIVYLEPVAYIKGLKNLKDSDSAEGAVESDGSEANTAFSGALGSGNIAGGLAYFWSAIDTKNKRIYLCNERVSTPVVGEDVGSVDESFEETGYEVGDEFSIINENNYPFCASIKSINHNVIEYEGDLGFTAVEASEKEYSYTFFVPAKPNEGVYRLGLASWCFGADNIIVDAYGTAGGRGNIVAAKYGTAFGKYCIAVYTSFAVGEECKAKGQGSTATCVKTETTKKAYGGSASGIKTVSNARAQSVRGRYNEIDEGGEYLDIVGNGYKDADGIEHRSNAYTLDEDGNARFAGKAYIGSAEKGSPDARELATVEDVDAVKLAIGMVKPAFEGLQVNKTMYGGIRSSMNVVQKTDLQTGIVYNHVTVNNADTVLLFDKTKTSRSAIKDGKVYFKILMRTNESVTPVAFIFSIYDADGNPVVGSGKSNEEGQYTTLGNGEWEEIILSVENIESVAASYAQVHIRFAGARKRGNEYYSGGNLIGSPYFDVAAWATFDTLEDAVSYDIKSAAAGLSGAKISEKLASKSPMGHTHNDKADNDLSNVSDAVFADKARQAGVGNEFRKTSFFDSTVTYTPGETFVYVDVLSVLTDMRTGNIIHDACGYVFRLEEIRLNDYYEYTFFCVGKWSEEDSAEASGGVNILSVSCDYSSIEYDSGEDTTKFSYYYAFSEGTDIPGGAASVFVPDLEVGAPYIGCRIAMFDYWGDGKNNSITYDAKFKGDVATYTGSIGKIFIIY